MKPKRIQSEFKRIEALSGLFFLISLLSISIFIINHTQNHINQENHNNQDLKTKSADATPPWTQTTIWSSIGAHWQGNPLETDIERDGAYEIFCFLEDNRLVKINFTEGAYQKYYYTSSLFSGKTFGGIGAHDYDKDGILELYATMIQDYGTYILSHIIQGQLQLDYSWSWSILFEYNNTKLSLGQIHVIDTDNDGEQELLIKTGSSIAEWLTFPLFSFDYNFSSMNFTPNTILEYQDYGGYSVIDNEGYSYICGDVDTDGLNEIVLMKFNQTWFELFLFNYIAHLQHWMNISLGEWGSLPVSEMHKNLDLIGDIDNDGFNELCLSRGSGTGNPAGNMYYIKKNGLNYALTGIMSRSNWNIGPGSRQILDINHDGLNEIIVAHSQECCNGAMYIVNGSGSDWDIQTVIDVFGNNFGAIIGTDLDRDGRYEIYHCEAYTSYEAFYVYRLNQYSSIPTSPQFLSFPSVIRFNSTQSFPLLTWPKVYASNLLNYHVQISAIANFSEVLDENTQISATTTEYALQLSNFDTNKVYWYRVSAINTTGESAFSQTMGFLIDSNPKWWDFAWEYRKSIEIDNSMNSETLYDYIKNISIIYEPNMALNFSDLRFINSQFNELSYWLEDYQEGVSASVWVKIPCIPGGSIISIEMYYGNLNAEPKSQFLFTFQRNATLEITYSNDYWNTKSLWEKPGSNQMYHFATFTGTPSSFYWNGDAWISDNTAAAGFPHHMAYQNRYYYYDDEFGEIMFLTSWENDYYNNSIMQWDGARWKKNTTLESGLSLPSDRYLFYFMFNFNNQRHLICPNYNKWTWTGTTWITNASVRDLPIFNGGFYPFHYKYTTSLGQTRFHWFPLILCVNNTNTEIFQFHNGNWNSIYSGNMGEYPRIEYDGYSPDMNVIEGRLTISEPMHTAVDGTEGLICWSSNLYFANIEPSYKTLNEVLFHESIYPSPFAANHFILKFNHTWTNTFNDGVVPPFFIDLNNDGTLEMLRQTNYQTEIYTYSEYSYVYLTTLATAVIAFGDYDGDDVKELVCVYSGDLNFYFYNFSMINLSLNLETTWITGYPTRESIHFGDLEHDGKEEFIYYDHGGPPTYGGDGPRRRLISFDAGIFTEVHSFDDPITQGWDGLADATLIDIDGDGLDEIVCGWGYGTGLDGIVRIFDDINQGFTQIYQNDFGRDPSFLTTFDTHEDLTGDGVKDLVLTTYSGNIVKFIVYYNTTTETVGILASLNYQTINHPNTFSVGNLCPIDDRARLVGYYGTDWDSDRININYWTGSVIESEAVVTFPMITDQTNLYSINCRDLNGDGYDEIIWEGQNAEGKQVSFFLYNKYLLESPDLLPVVNFTTNATSILLGDLIQFNDTSTGGDSPLIYEWNFGDGTPVSTEQNPIHLYSNSGNFTASLEVTDNNGDVAIFSMLISVYPNIDTDGDGIPDFREIFTYGTDPTNPDSDEDDLTDFEEIFIYYTNATNSDTDADGLNDGEEVNLHGTNPIVSDTDADGLDDGDEVNLHGTNPTVLDTDADGLDDGVEVTLYFTDPLDDDTDADGIKDGAEIITYGTNATNPDTDSDNLNDYDEIFTYTTNVTNPDSDTDGVVDGDEVYIYYTNPMLNDTDGDVLLDGEELFIYGTDPLLRDSDGDGVDDGTEINNGTNPTTPNIDTDGDGLPDWWEIIFNYNYTIWDSCLDSDDDGLSTLGEYQAGTNPTRQDSDDDGIFDGFEVLMYHTNPLSNDSDTDGLIDTFELFDAITNPNCNDSDSDGIDDFYEVLVYDTNANDPDSDNDQLNDYDEITLGTNATNPDTDADGLTDYEEVAIYGTIPNDADVDQDDLMDYEELYYHTNPFSNDTDNDDLADNVELFVYLTNPTDPDTDNDTLLDFFEIFFGLNASNIDTDSDLLIDPLELEFGSNPHVNDSDADGLPDVWEHAYHLNCTIDDSGIDRDSDTMTNYEELLLGTNPNLADTDADGLLDGNERNAATDPLNNDTDTDGLLDGWEINLYGSNPLSNDTDLDGLLDWFEIYYNANITYFDTDLDTLYDGDEILIYNTDPKNTDTDSDGLLDSEEIFDYGTNASNADTDSDGLSDSEELLINNTNPFSPDSDGDTLLDGDEVFDFHTNPITNDTDHDGLLDPNEFLHAANATNADSDNDGMSDGWEILYGLQVTVEDANQDNDGDGLSNGEEFVYGTNPINDDTDEDSYTDGLEIEKNTNPLDPNDYPKENWFENLIRPEVRKKYAPYVIAVGGGLLLYPGPGISVIRLIIKKLKTIIAKRAENKIVKFKM